MGVPILRVMPLVQAFRVLLVLLALFAVVPTQTGGALAVDELGLTAADTSDRPSITDHGPQKNPVKPAHHASFAAPDDGTAAGAALPDWPATDVPALPFARIAADPESATGTRLDRPPKSV